MKFQDISPQDTRLPVHSHFCITLFSPELGSQLLTQGPTAAAVAAKSLQLCPTLCNPIDSSPPGSPVPGILQARTLEWVVISFFNAWKWKVKGKSLSRVQLFATPWTAAYQAPPSMGFSRQEYWSGLPLTAGARFSHLHYCLQENCQSYHGIDRWSKSYHHQYVNMEEDFGNPHFFLWTFYFVLEYSQLTMLW